MAEEIKSVDDLLNGILSPNKQSIKELFEQKIKQLGISMSDSQEILTIQSRTLKGILDGSLKMFDVTNLFKIADFIQLPKEDVVKMYFDMLDKNFSNSSFPSSKIQFIKENFDLAALKKAGFIDDISDFPNIDRKLTTFLGLKSIFEYSRPNIKPAFSAGLIPPKNKLTRDLWLDAGITMLNIIDNPYEYNREELKNYFSNIRWHSTNVEKGLIAVINDLYHLGVTVIYQDPLPSLHLRGATLQINEKPCIILTNYVGFYATIWFALIHELFHVLFDWDDIKLNRYHVSDDDENELLVLEREKDANNFAREYLLPKEKLSIVKQRINNEYFVKEFAYNNDIHTSMIYVFAAYDGSQSNRSAWARAKKHEPNIDLSIGEIKNSWKSPIPVNDFVMELRNKNIYN